ncbi:TetR/AcrR family transcriptional regulator [Terriglobus tenax]|uniref:TetR/AcrR family transcriptional regulator n=1 Tax=Terriglobus tenax TaxID=1111115 RepID=UPI0021DFACC5|nr:TetR/AcrR family transcriptional regulator [Terriglobus tenax]
MKSSTRNKHQIKSETTRAALLQAAETIFARDGFERAQIDEIARESGRTRGAVYAQYKTKEQLFFALQTNRIRQAVQEFQELVADSAQDDFEGRLAALRRYYADSLYVETALLDLEMKLYALRHTESVEDLRESYRQMYPTGNVTREFGIANEPGRSRVESRVLALSAIKSGLVLAMQFQPDVLSRKEIKRLLAEVFDGLFPEKSIRRKGKRAARK